MAGCSLTKYHGLGAEVGALPCSTSLSFPPSNSRASFIFIQTARSLVGLACPPSHCVGAWLPALSHIGTALLLTVVLKVASPGTALFGIVKRRRGSKTGHAGDRGTRSWVLGGQREAVLIPWDLLSGGAAWGAQRSQHHSGVHGGLACSDGYRVCGCR